MLLAIFAALGYFHIQAIFIDFFCGLVKGLIGYGYLLLPPMLLVASGILAFHRGRPVRLRVWCAHHITEALFKSLGVAVKEAVQITGTGVTSTKGVL